MSAPADPSPPTAPLLPSRLPWLTWLERIASAAALIFAAGWFVILGRGHMHMVLAPGPQELNEPAAWYATWLIDNHRNPFDPGETPASAQFFGPLYNYVVLALRPALGVSYVDYEAHRLVNFFCIAGVLALIGSEMRRHGTSRAVTALALLAVYSLATNNIMTTARPDALGWLFFMIGVVVPARSEYRRWSVFVALGCALLGTQCKMYFGFAAFPALLATATRRSIREALALGVGFVCAIAALIYGLTKIYPLYFTETIFMQSRSVALNSAPEFLDRHTMMMFEHGWPFLVLLAFALATFLARIDWREVLASLRAKTLRLANLLPPTAVPIYAITFLVGALFVQEVMAINGGATFTYHIHLLFPFLCILVGAYAITPWRRIAALAALAVGLILTLERPWMPDSSPGYRELERRLSQYTHVLGLGTSIDILARQNKPVNNDGFTLYLPCVFDGGPYGRTPLIDQVEQQFAATVDSVRNDIAQERFEVVLTHDDRNPPYLDIDLLRAHYEYRESEVLDVPMRFAWDHIYFWYPKHPKPDAAKSPTTPP